jgi:hypothetical protein
VGLPPRGAGTLEPSYPEYYPLERKEGHQENLMPLVCSSINLF